MDGAPTHAPTQANSSLTSQQQHKLQQHQQQRQCMYMDPIGLRCPTELILRKPALPYYLAAYTSWSLQRKIWSDIDQCPLILMHVDDPTCTDIAAAAKSPHILGALLSENSHYCTEEHWYCLLQNEMRIIGMLCQPPLTAKKDYLDCYEQLQHSLPHSFRLIIEHVERKLQQDALIPPALQLDILHPDRPPSALKVLILPFLRLVEGDAMAAELTPSQQHNPLKIDHYWSSVVVAAVPTILYPGDSCQKTALSPAV
jgi:hypothetical protein